MSEKQDINIPQDVAQYNNYSETEKHKRYEKNPILPKEAENHNDQKNNGYHGEKRKTRPFGNKRPVGHNPQNNNNHRTKPSAVIQETQELADQPSILLNDMRRKPLPELYTLAEAHGVDPLQSKGGRSDIIFNIAKVLTRQGQAMTVEGVLQLVDDNNAHGYGFLRSPGSYQVGADDIYVPSQLIKKFHLRTGDTVVGNIRSPKESERYLALVNVESINFYPPEKARTLVPFRDLTADFPTEWLKLEQGNGTQEDLTGRMIDMIAPLGKGQRSLIVSPPKAGKTMMLQRIAQSILANNPEVYLIVLLIDERPEEVTDFIRNVKAEVVSSTFDETPANHVQKAELTIAKGKRLANNGFDVVILLDSITRLARAYNTITPTSGKVLTGGLDANALQRPKRFFGAARNIHEGGSLTIIATALIETGSKMDDVIYEEFKGTGNNEIHLSRQIAQKGIFPAMDVNASGTRRDDRLLPTEYINNAWILKKYMQNQDNIVALEFLLERMKATKLNHDLFMAMRSK